MKTDINESHSVYSHMSAPHLPPLVALSSPKGAPGVCTEVTVEPAWGLTHTAALILLHHSICQMLLIMFIINRQFICISFGVNIRFTCCSWRSLYMWVSVIAVHPQVHTLCNKDIHDHVWPRFRNCAVCWWIWQLLQPSVSQTWFSVFST